METFDPKLIKGIWEPDDHQLMVLKSYHSDMMSHFEGLDKNDYDKLVIVFEPSDKRDAFEEDFKKFAKVYNTQLYKKETTQYLDDFKELCKIRHVLRNSYELPQVSTRSYAHMIQKIIDDAIRSSGVSVLVDSMEITFENFMAYVAKFRPPRARTA